MNLRMIIGTALVSALAFSAVAEEISVSHLHGETTIATRPETVVVFDLASLDTLDALGIQVDGVPGGVLPPYLVAYENGGNATVGTVFEPDYEAVAALAPDLIIIGGRSSPKYDELSQLAPTIDLTVDATDFLASMRENVETLGRIFEKEEEAAEQLAKLDESVLALREKAANAGTGLLLLTTGGRMSTHGPNGRFAVLFRDFGITPAVEEIDAGMHGQAISHEFILDANPDWLFVIDRDAAIGREGKPARELLDNALVQKTTAWQEDHVVYLDAAHWYLVGGGLTAMQQSVDQILEALGK